jgi:hypothetical protein
MHKYQYVVCEECEFRDLGTGGTQGNRVRHVRMHMAYMFLLSLLHYLTRKGSRGGAVVEALSYKPEGRGIDSRWCHWNFSLA